jgi:predicted Zn-dependent peptidase
MSSPVFSGDKVIQTNLTNGLTLLTLEDHSSPLVAITVAYHVGSKNECPGTTGLSQICTRFIQSGTEIYKRGEFSRIIQGGGGWSRAHSDLDITLFTTKVPSNMLDTVLFLEADRMQNVELTYEKFMIAKDALRKVRVTYVENSIYGHINEEFLNLAFRSHPYQNPRYGWPADIDNITLEDSKKFFRLYFQPANAVVTIAGDFKTEKVTSRVRELFENITSAAIPTKSRIIEPVQYGERHAYLVGSAGVPAFIIGYHIPEVTHEDIPAIRIISTLLSGGESSRIYRRMVKEEKSAMYIGGGLIDAEDPSIIFCYAILNYDYPNSVGEYQMDEEIIKIKSEPVSDAELEKAKNRIEVEYFRQIRFLDHKTDGLTFCQIIAGDWQAYENVVSLARDVTGEDIIKVAQKYFTKSNRTVVFLSPTESIEDNPTDELE